MDAIPFALRPPLRHRVPPAARTVLAWGGIAAFPFFLVLTVLVISNDGRPYVNVLESIPRYLLPAIVMALPATLLRRSPLTTLALMLVGSAGLTTGISLDTPGYLGDLRYLQLFAIDVVVGFVAAGRPRRISVGTAVLALCAQITIGYTNPVSDDPIFQPEIPSLAMIAAWMIGNSVRARRQHAEALRAQATVQAVTAERLRIAREMHDMVAHSIGIIAIQAGVGSRVIDTQPAEARNALRAIEATSRDTLAGLRRVLGGLRPGQQDTGSEPASLSPTPGLADVDRLAATTSAAGVRVEVCWRGERRPLPADIELSAYRVIQEAVTNVVRHAGTARCRVSVEYRAEELHVEVTDDGHGAPAPGTGHGITGMRERVGLLHGEFSAGPRPGGGFRVSATLPLREPVSTPAAPR
ncbi:sensor histidine kinase [Plantactinospora soyae]|uniref:histidine kinase n=1 Tax=Plantactinospora soyae TaxID=1544732 RepID=A0A927R8H4_9ACTN|nr:sensor histidine kinase [Plantactinospora soyae]MBE1490439.1 signal transduction histidine kinase [Plantactinospora soyae]